jgi:hypothetical protein
MTAGNTQEAFSNWQGGNDPYGNETAPLLGPVPSFRGDKDRRLAAFGSTPDTQYPDGYLGTMSSNRRQDKILDAVKRQNHRSYSRGVHKGERINPGDYWWPDEFNLTTGLELQAQGKKFAPPGAEPVRLTNDGKAGPRGIPRGLDRQQLEVINAERRSMLQRLAPGWK